MNRPAGLGRGLSALLPQEPTSGVALRDLALDDIDPNPRQPREVFDDAELAGLAQSIADVGLLQPIVVRPAGARYELVAGERRVRAARRAGLAEVPAVVRVTDDTSLLKDALTENIHRVQLNPLEEAAAYQQLLDDFGFTQEELATRLGKSRPTISNALRILTLPSGVQRKVAAGVLSAGHAKALLGLAAPSQQERVADQIVAAGLSVRGAEEVVRREVADDGPKPPRPPSDRAIPSPGVLELQHELSDALRTRVRITMGKRRGKLQVDLASPEDLDRIVDVIARGLERRAGVQPAELPPSSVE